MASLPLFVKRNLHGSAAHWSVLSASTGDLSQPHGRRPQFRTGKLRKPCRR